jgi:hypothetical protein
MAEQHVQCPLLSPVPWEGWGFVGMWGLGIV